MKISKFLICLAVLFSGVQLANAQSETRLGGMLAYGTEVENLGIGAIAEFPIAEKFTISPSFIYFLPNDVGGVDINWFEVNGNANYYFLEQENLGVYGLAGLNYTHVKVDYDGPGAEFIDAAASDGRVGLNLGGGANFNIGKNFVPFAELKYVIIDGGQLVVAAGVKFNL